MTFVLFRSKKLTILPDQKLTSKLTHFLQKMLLSEELLLVITELKYSGVMMTSKFLIWKSMFFVTKLVMHQDLLIPMVMVLIRIGMFLIPLCHIMFGQVQEFLLIMDLLIQINKLLENYGILNQPIVFFLQKILLRTLLYPYST